MFLQPFPFPSREGIISGCAIKLSATMPAAIGTDPETEPNRALVFTLQSSALVVISAPYLSSVMTGVTGGTVVEDITPISYTAGFDGFGTTAQVLTGVSGGTNIDDVAALSATQYYGSVLPGVPVQLPAGTYGVICTGIPYNNNPETVEIVIEEL